MTKMIHSQGARELAPQAYAAMVARASRRTDVSMTVLKANTSFCWMILIRLPLAGFMS